jgi:hypothetical protein
MADEIDKKPSAQGQRRDLNLVQASDEVAPTYEDLGIDKRRVCSLLAAEDFSAVAPFERGEIGPDLFRAACRMGLEGLVSKHRDRLYRGGRQKFWIKVKNRSHPAMEREL